MPPDSGDATPAPVLPDDMTLLEAAQLATARHLHLVFDHRDQQQKLTPVVMPWHTRYGVLDKALSGKIA